MYTDPTPDGPIFHSSDRVNVVELLSTVYGVCLGVDKKK